MSSGIFLESFSLKIKKLNRSSSMFNINIEAESSVVGAPSSSILIFLKSIFLAIKLLKYRLKSLIVVGHPVKKCLYVSLHTGLKFVREQKVQSGEVVLF